jgi:hypothetical protein
MDAGLIVSFISNDQAEQQVLLDWQSQFVPQPGDVVSCVEEDGEGNVARRLTGTVVGPRRVEIRRSTAGDVSLWIRLIAEKTTLDGHAANGQKVQVHNGHAQNGKHRRSCNGASGRLVRT